MENNDGSSHLFPKIGRSSSTLGMAGATNNLISNIRSSYIAKTTKEATKYVAADHSLSEEQRAILCIYYGKHMAEAAALSDMGGSLRSAVFRKVLGGLPSDFLYYI
jgi:hypothetical protein